MLRGEYIILKGTGINGLIAFFKNAEGCLVNFPGFNIHCCLRHRYLPKALIAAAMCIEENILLVSG